MDLANVPTYSVTRLEKLAAECLAEKLSAVSPPIDVEYLLETEPGVLLDILPGLESRFGVNGVVYRRGSEQYLVVIDADLADRPNSHRYRFTVGEELAHVRLHRDVLSAIDNVVGAIELMQQDVYWDMDRNARCFAAAVLMPPSEVRATTRRKYPSLVDDFGFDRPAEVLDAMRRELSHEFRVSPESMGYRMKNWPVTVVGQVERSLRQRSATLLPFDST